MLGGYGNLSEIDIKESKQFLEDLGVSEKEKTSQNLKAIDIGAGIGRVTKHLL